MKVKKYILAVDIGTSSTKAVVFDNNGTYISKESVTYPMHSPKPSWSEQDPEEVFNAVVDSIKEVIKKGDINKDNIIGISFSSAMHSLIAIDESGNNLTQCITWADNRSIQYTEQLKNNWDGYEIYRRTGTPLHPMAPLSKILWFKHENIEVYNKTSKWISIKEYVFYKFFGEFLVDYSIASGTGIFNLTNLNWDEDVLQLLGITKDNLSTPVPTTYQVIGLLKEWQEVLGINENTPFIIGAADGVLANLGVGAIKSNVTAITIGTSGAVRKVTNKPVTDKNGRIFCYALTENLWVVGGAINNGGIVFQWIRDRLASLEVETALKNGIDPYEYLTEIANGVKAGSEGLIFLPYLTGERAPHWNANARGVFFGISNHHQKSHMIRAALEGVIYQLYSVYQILEELTGYSGEIRANGGFARSDLWSQIMADVFALKVKIPEIYESSAYGAAKLGLYSLGILISLDSDEPSSMRELTPHKEDTIVYQGLYGIFSRLYTNINNEFEEIIKYQLEVTT